MAVAIKLCDIVKTEGSVETTTATGKIDAELNGFWRLIASLGLSASVTTESVRYHGVRQQDLAQALTNVPECRKQTFANLMARIPPPQLTSSAAAPVHMPGLQSLPLAAPGQIGWQRDTRTGCHIWDQAPDTAAMVSWSGGCVGGKASGDGTIEWRAPTGHQLITGTAFDGKIQGRATMVEEGFGMLATKMSSVFLDGVPKRGFTVMWGDDGVHISGDLDPITGSAAGPIVITGNDYRYEGPVDEKLRPNGVGLFTEPGRAPLSLSFNHGCAVHPSGRWIGLSRDHPCS